MCASEDVCGATGSNRGSSARRPRALSESASDSSPSWAATDSMCEAAGDHCLVVARTGSDARLIPCVPGVSQ